MPRLPRRSITAPRIDGPISAFARVYLPQTYPGVAAGGLLVASYGIDFVATAIGVGAGLAVDGLALAPNFESPANVRVVVLLAIGAIDIGDGRSSQLCDGSRGNHEFWLKQRTKIMKQ